MIEFFKYNSNGNDFIILDNRKKSLDFLIDKNCLIQNLCKREFSIGADGVILLHNSKISDYKMQIFNSDGFEATMCGNALVCLVKFINDNIEKKKSFLIETKVFTYKTYIDDKKISFQSKYPRILNKNVQINIENLNFDIQIFDSGVLHGIIFTKNIQNIDVFNLGKKIRNFKQFLPGINVNFCEIISDNRLKVRTFEKGVENETYCCSTGALATSYSYFLKKNKNFLKPLQLDYIGGKIFIEFKKDCLYLTSEPNLAYSGQISIDKKNFF